MNNHTSLRDFIDTLTLRADNSDNQSCYLLALCKRFADLEVIPLNLFAYFVTDGKSEWLELSANSTHRA